jgi:hypothetical protein
MATSQLRQPAGMETSQLRQPAGMETSQLRQPAGMATSQLRQPAGMAAHLGKMAPQLVLAACGGAELKARDRAEGGRVATCPYKEGP